MSLKAVHLVFITLSILLAAGVGGWGARQYAETGDMGGLGLAGLFAATGVTLTIYVIRFWRKMREIGA